MKVFVAVLLLLVQIALPEACPFNCRCTKYNIFCRDSRMRSLPQGRPTTMLVSIKGDVLSTLNQSVVSKSGLGNLTTLELIGTNINVIQSHTFISMGILESLTISKNNIIDLQSEAFLGLDKLIKLDLSSNKLTNLSSGVFEGLLGLRYLILAYNDIQDIHSRFFDGLRRDCSLGVANTITSIDLYGNSVSKVDDEAFRGLCSLKFLKIRFYFEKYDVTNSVNFNSMVSLRRLQILGSYSKIKITTRKLYNLRHLEIIFSNLPKLHTSFLENSKFLKTLSITSSSVQELELGCFKGLQFLSELNLSHNKLNSLSEGVYSDLESVQKLDLSQNGLEIIQGNLFMGLVRLKILDLRKNPIFSLEINAFYNLHFLRELLLYTPTTEHDYNGIRYDENNFGSIFFIDSDAFNGLFSLKSLQLASCCRHNSTNVTLQSLRRLDSFQGPEHFAPNKFQVMKTLSFMIWGDLIPSEIDKWFSQVMYPNQVLILDIYEFNSLTELKLPSDFNIPKLVIRRCKKCVIGNNSFVASRTLLSLIISCLSRIQIEEGAFINAENLQYLELYTEQRYQPSSGMFQALSMLPNRKYSNPGDGNILRQDKFKGLKSLQIFRLIYQGIRGLDVGTFRELEILQVLDLRSNLLSNLKGGEFHGLYSLRELDLSYNNISVVSAGAFDGLRSIEKINLLENQIESIGVGVFGAICDENFTLTPTNLTRLDKFCNTSFALATLTFLGMNNNSIQFIHKHAFLGCNKLRQLGLGFNKLLALDFLYTPQLTLLDLSNNHNISEISNDTFSCTPILANIILWSTNVNYMHVNALKHLKNLKYMYLPIMNFDCRLQEIWFWLRSRNIQVVDSYTRNTIEQAMSKLECNSSTDFTTQPRNESSTADEYMYFKIYIEPIVFIFIFLSGCFGNGLLLFIVLSHSDMRSRTNACVAHLAIADILSLVLNLPLSYWDVLHVNWDLGETTCKIFITCKDLVVALVVFSVVALTFERYLVVQTFNKLKSPHGNTRRPIVFLVIVWMYALVSSFPSYFHATVEGRCLSSAPGSDRYFQRLWILQLLMYCFLPAVSIIVLNIISALNLKKSILEIPREIIYPSRDKSRNTVANVVMVLSLVFTLSSLPNFLLRTLVSWSVWTFEEVFWYSFVTYCLFFFHTIFNPFALFVMGSKYKSHIKEYVRFFIKEWEQVPTSPDSRKELENVCDVLQKLGQRFVGIHQEEEFEETDDIGASDEAVRRARQKRLKKLQARFL